MNHREWVALLNGKQEHDGQYKARCPAHDDQTASLRISTAEPSKTLLHCHAGCDVKAIVAAVGKTMSDLFADSPEKAPRVLTTQPVAVYSYTDTTGKVKLEKRRFPPKEFRWFHLNEAGNWMVGRAGATPALYNAAVAADKKTVLWVEGEKDVETLKAHGIAAVCAQDGAKSKIKPEQLEPLRGKWVVILPDNDKPGKEHAQAVASTLQGVAAGVKVLDLTKIDPALPEKGDITDLYAKMDVTAKLGKLAKETPDWKPEDTQEPPQIVFYDTVEYKEPEFLIKPYIPQGKVTILQADSGVGKTALACKIAACVSTGQPMQDTPCPQGRVLILSVEDDPETLRGRIEASGGDLKQCAFLENAHELTFINPQIEQAITTYGISLVIFDPLQAFLGAGMDMHRANETRPIMAQLSAMAKRTNSAVIIISHMSKGTAGGKAIYRALGSVDIPAASRSVLYVERNPDDEEQCVMVQTKSSNAKPGKTILYRIGDRGGVQWEGYSSLTYDDLQTQAERREKGIAYDEEPIVQVISALHQDNPQGVFVSWEQLDNYANKVLGYFPCQSGKEWNAKLKALQREFTEKSRIQFEFRLSSTERLAYWRIWEQRRGKPGAAL